MKADRCHAETAVIVHYLFISDPLLRTSIQVQFQSFYMYLLQLSAKDKYEPPSKN